MHLKEGGSLIATYQHVRQLSDFSPDFGRAPSTVNFDNSSNTIDVFFEAMFGGELAR